MEYNIYIYSYIYDINILWIHILIIIPINQMIMKIIIYIYIYISVCVINDNVNIKDLINKSMDMGNQRNIGDFSLAIDWGFFHVKHGDLMLCIPHDVG